MPPKTYKRKRKPRTNRRFKRKQLTKSSIPRVMRPKVYRFKRDIEETLALSSSTAPEGWTLDGSSRIYKNMGFALAQLGDVSDFTSLYRQYKINGARVRFYFSNTVSGMHQTNSTGSNYSNSQIMVRMAPNQKGEVEALDNAYWQSIQAKKYKLAINGGRPVDIYIPLKSRNIVQTSSGTQSVMGRPQFAPTENTSVLYEGINIAIDRIDGQGFSTGAYNNLQYCKVITTLYFHMRGVE